MKNALGGINKRLYISEEKISELIGKAIETIQKWNTEKRLEKKLTGYQWIVGQYQVIK